MSRLDEELKIAIRRHEPSEGFADRVVARIAIGQATSQGKRTAGGGHCFAFLKLRGLAGQLPGLWPAC